MEPLDISARGKFSIRGQDYMISLECKGKSSLTVLVEDTISSDQWTASFDAQYIEDLTHKTGNFKQFDIFANMLESAILKTSESVSLDLLTYNDLEVLRQKKSGVSNIKSSVPASRMNHLMSKRYLILTYTVEFDRIHYPLPLPYVGKPDPRALQEEIRSLRAELKRVKQAHPSGESRMEKLLRDYRKLEREKNELEQEFADFRREVRISSGSNTVHDMRTLRTIVRNLEEQLTKEKTHHQRATSKRSQEYRDLLEEVEELRASERNLRVRVKSLINELAMYKRGRTLTRKGSQGQNDSMERQTTDRKRSSSWQRSVSNDRVPGRSGSGTRQRSGSRERPQYIRRSNSTEQLPRSSLNGSGLRGRSSSFDRNNSGNRSRLSTGSGSNRSRTPSPAGSRRFNPTEFVKEKKRKQRELDFKKDREHRANLSGGSSRSRRQGNNSSRNSGYSYRCSRENSLRSEGNVSDGYGSDGSYTSRPKLKNGETAEEREQSSTHKNSMAKNVTTDTTRPPAAKSLKQLSSTPEFSSKKTKAKVNHVSAAESDDEDSEYFDRSAEISEIDERLDRLQQLMKVAMP